MADLAVAGVGLWPMRPRPFFDEAFSSWFYRLAAANSVRLHSFTSAAFPSKQVWNRDLDALEDDEIFLALERGTGISHERLRAKTLRAYQGTVFEQFNTHGTTPLVLPLGLYHRIRRGFGFQFCPHCLSADKVPYARLEWRLACVTSCQRHGCRLLDRCGNCSGPYVFHRRGFHMCFSCGHDLRHCSTEPANQVALDCEALMRGAMAGDDGLCKVLNSKHSIISFSVIHDLLSLLSFGKRAPAFRQAVHRIFGGPAPSDPVCNGQVRIFEMLDVTSRHSAVAQLGLLLRRWPLNFVQAACEASLWRSWILRERKLSEVPFPLARLLGTMVVPDHASITGRKTTQQVTRGRLAGHRKVANVARPLRQREYR